MNSTARLHPDPRHPRRRQRVGGQRGGQPGGVRQQQRPRRAHELWPQALPAQGEEEDPGGRGLRRHERGVEGDGGAGNLPGPRRLSSQGRYRIKLCVKHFICEFSFRHFE